MSSNKCKSYVCRMISRKLRRAMQVTSLPVVEPKRGKAAGESPDLQSAGIGWTSLISPDIIVYNQNQQAKTGEPPPSAPSLMLTPPRGAPWHFSGIADGGIAPVMGWLVVAHAVACALLVVLMVIFIRFLDRYKPLLRLRGQLARSRIQELNQGPSDMHVLQIHQEFPPFSSESTDSISAPDLPPSYFETSEPPPPYTDPNAPFTKFENPRRKMKDTEPQPPTVCLIVEGGRTCLGLIVNEELVPAGSQGIKEANATKLEINKEKQ
ncbi:uncharacterized protein [Epargyreus clarus]|uniref:uncharacterized protein isoform X3 n=1 Tax=Epargyreus clarus TaxID=520877 RepID=UPI003C2B1926